MWAREKWIKGFCGETERKRTIGRPRHRREDNIKTDVQEVGWRRIALIWLRMVRDDGLM